MLTLKTLSASLLFALLLAGAATVSAQSGVTVGTNIVDVSKLPGNETDPSIVINPLNVSNLFITATVDEDQPGLFTAWSTNRGLSWATNIIATNADAQGLTPAYGESSAAWDAYGNLFVAYLPSDFEGVAVVLSTNGGQTFSSVTNLAPLDATDTPRLTCPPAGAGADSVWIVYKDYSLADTPLLAQAELASGLGTNGAFTPQLEIPGSSNGGLEDIAVGPAGQVLVTYQASLNSPVSGSLFASLDTNGITTNGFGTNFGVPVLVADNAIGGATNPPAELTGPGLNASAGAAWDCDPFSPYYGRAYIVYTGLGLGGNMVIDTCYSTNNGTDWSDPEVVNDDTGTNDHFLPHLAVDPATGIVGYVWFDLRNDTGQDNGGPPPVTKTTLFTIKLTGQLVTNALFIETNSITNNSSITYAFTDLSGGNGSNILIAISGNNINGTTVTNSGDVVYVGNATNTNFILTLQDVSTNSNASVVIQVNNTFPETYTLGGANQAAILYSTVSTNGLATFAPNQPVIKPNSINPPAVSIASVFADSTSLMGWGNHTGLVAQGANFFPAWPDNSDITGNNPDGPESNFDILTLGGSNAISLPVADIGVTVSNFPNPVISAGVLVYTMIVSNYGPMPSGPLTVTDELPASVTLEDVVPGLHVTYTNLITNLIFAIPNLSPQASITNTIRVDATTSALVTNTVIAAGSLIDLNPTNNTVQTVLLIEGQDLELGMTTSESNALIGDFVTNAITVTNLGPSTNGPVFITNVLTPHFGNITVQTPGAYYVTNQIDSLGTGELETNPVVVIDLGLLPPNMPVTSLVIAQVMSYDAYGQLGASTANVTSQDFDTNLANNSAATTIFVNGEDLGVGVSSPSNTDTGTPFVTTISVTNFGPSFSGFVTVTDIISTNLGTFAVNQSQGTFYTTNLTVGGATNPAVIFPLGPLGAGQVATINLSAVSSGPALAASNFVTVSSTDFDTNSANNTAASAITVSGEDLVLSFSEPARANLGEPFVSTTLITNLGPSSSGFVTASNRFDSNLGQLVVNPSQGTYYITNVVKAGATNSIVIFEVGTLGVGQVAALSVSSVPSGNRLASTNYASVWSTDFDPNTANNKATDIVDINGEDLGVGLAVSRTNVQVGQDVIFTTSVTNFGLSTNGTVFVTNTIPASFGQGRVLQSAGNYIISSNSYIFDLGTLSAGQSATISVDAVALQPGTVSSTASVGSGDFDAVPGNNSAKASVTIIPALPMISNIVVTPLASGAFISFRTGQAATAQVEYGLTPSYGSVSSESLTPSSNHVVLLSGLTRDTNYYFDIVATVNTAEYSTNGRFATSNTLILQTPDASYSGVWIASSTAPGFYGAYYQIAATTNVFPTASAAFVPQIPESGQYDVSIWYPQSPQFTTNASLVISGATNQIGLAVNQTINGGQWDLLSNDVYFAAGTSGNVTIYNGTGETNRDVVANAMRWVYDAAQDYPTNGAVPAWWANYFFGTNVSGAADLDGDGYSNYAKYVLGLDPTNAADSLNFNIAQSNGVVTVTFSPWQGGRDYTLLSSPDLTSGSWTPLTNTVTVNAAGDGVFVLTQSGAADLFYRLSASLVPQ